MSNRYKESNRLIKKALDVIPLGSQTFSKSITQFPRGVSPLFIERGKGSHVWDVDENEYIDFINGLCSVTIGYSDSDIDYAIKRQLDSGISFSLPHRLEMDVAQIIVDMVPGADMVRFGKNGTDVTSAAIRLSRAYTGRDHVAVCGYHGWQDWYIGITTKNLGVPKEVSNLTHVFEYNNIESLKKIFESNKDTVAAVIMEPMNIEWPKDDFLHEVKNIVKFYGSVLIFDENITGFRYANGGAQELFGVVPDLSTFGKGLGNGCPISAIVGNRKIMKGMKDIFFSSTFGGETISLSAAKAVLNKIKNDGVVDKLSKIGTSVILGFNRAVNKYKLESILDIKGHPSWSIVIFKDSATYNGLQIKTFIMQEMFKRGILFTGSHNISFSHTKEDIEKLMTVYDEVFDILSMSIQNGTLENLLEVDPIQQLFSIR
jgi:glutamate-1-semialdehyde 2,1-aminomutase